MKKEIELVLSIALVAIMIITAVLLVIFLNLPPKKLPPTKIDENEVRQMMDTEFQPTGLEIMNEIQKAKYAFQTDLTSEEKEAAVINANLKFAHFKKMYWNKYFKYIRPEDIKNGTLQRLVKIAMSRLFSQISLNDEKEIKLSEAQNSLVSIYSTAKVCPFENQQCDLEKEGLSLEPQIRDIFAKLENYEELAYLWKAWRDATGGKMKEIYKTYVELSNEAAVGANFKDLGHVWISYYESATFRKDMDRLWSQVEPLYTELHKYVGRKLEEKFPSKFNSSDGLLPAHIFGNMWASSWRPLATFVRPYPEASKINLNTILKNKKLKVLDLFQIANDFYQSMGLLPGDISYNTTTGAVITKPRDKKVVCTPSAWDFFDGESFRLKMCARVIHEYFIRIHHEMAHIQYYLQYRRQPLLFRDGPNPSFHETIGDLFALSIASPQHLQKINLLQDYVYNKESSVNALMVMALDKIAVLPFLMILDKWRWDVFSGKVDKTTWNSHWWYYRKKYQKVKPPVDRSDVTDFDPGSRYQVPAGQSYISFFVANIFQFQLFRSLCIEAEEYNIKNTSRPLYRCDFYNSKKVGKKISKALALGASKHWFEVMELLTGERKISASPVLEYFQPLYEFLKEKNAEEN